MLTKRLTKQKKSGAPPELLRHREGLPGVSPGGYLGELEAPPPSYPGHPAYRDHGGGNHFLISVSDPFGSVSFWLVGSGSVS